mmetsp:Transcript_6334/g.12572  ORF Transcript_6334/g.12572 Transcript_6334/m.12572 type:complete len:131 (-) Transcript_6334:1163-1555(-)
MRGIFVWRFSGQQRISGHTDKQGFSQKQTQHLFLRSSNKQHGVIYFPTNTVGLSQFSPSFLACTSIRLRGIIEKFKILKTILNSEAKNSCSLWCSFNTTYFLDDSFPSISWGLDHFVCLSSSAYRPLFVF